MPNKKTEALCLVYIKEHYYDDETGEALCRILEKGFSLEKVNEILINQGKEIHTNDYDAFKFWVNYHKKAVDRDDNASRRIRRIKISSDEDGEKRGGYEYASLVSYDVIERLHESDSSNDEDDEMENISDLESFDSEYSEDSDRYFSSIIETINRLSYTPQSIANNILVSEIREFVHNDLLCQLSDTCRQVIQMLYLDNNCECEGVWKKRKDWKTSTQAQVAKKLGIDQATVSRCEKNALKLLKSFLLRKGHTVDDFKRFFSNCV